MLHSIDLLYGLRNFLLLYNLSPVIFVREISVYLYLNVGKTTIRFGLVHELKELGEKGVDILLLLCEGNVMVRPLIYTTICTWSFSRTTYTFSVDSS